MSLQTLTVCNNTTGLENQTGAERSPQHFPENRVSPRASPNHHISNGPLNKVSVLSCYLRGEGFVWSLWFNLSYLLDAF